MNFKRPSFLILSKEKKELKYIKVVNKRRVQAEIDSYKDPDDQDRTDCNSSSRNIDARKLIYLIIQTISNKVV